MQERKRERLRCKKQRDCDRHVAENTQRAQQKEARLVRWRVRDRVHRASQPAAEHA